MNDAPSLTLTVAESQEPITLESSCLLVFIDETGDEAFSDPQHPVFGLGGCAMLVADYTTWVRPRWLQMKQRFFGGPDVPLHANELRVPSQAQIDALCEVFAIDRFTRVVAVASSKAAFPDGHPPYQLIALTLMKRIERAGSRFPECVNENETLVMRI